MSASVEMVLDHNVTTLANDTVIMCVPRSPRLSCASSRAS